MLERRCYKRKWARPEAAPTVISQSSRLGCALDSTARVDGGRVDDVDGPTRARLCRSSLRFERPRPDLIAINLKKQDG